MNALSAPPAAAGPPIAILGVPFDSVTAAEALRLIGAMIAARTPSYWATVDVDLAMQAEKDQDLRRFLMDAPLVLCADSRLRWASRLLGNPLPECIGSADLTVLVLAAAAQNGWRVFFLGGASADLDRAVETMQATYPRLQLVGAYAPPEEPLLQMDHADICRRVAEAKPDLLLVALGSPKQEKWISMHYRSLGAVVSFGVSPDWVAPVAGGAPHPVREPARRQAPGTNHLWSFGRAVLRQAWHLRARRRKAAAPSRSSLRSLGGQALQVLQMPAHLDAASVRAEQSLWERAQAGGGHLLADLSRVNFLDSTGLALLLRLQRTTRAAGRQFGLLAPKPVVQRALKLMGVSEAMPSSADLPAAFELLAQRAGEAIVAVTLGVPAWDEPLAWQGEVTAANVEEVWRMTEPHLNCSAGRHERIAINLADLRFLDSAGVALMVRARKHARRAGLELRFSAPQPAVLNVIRQLQLEGYLLRQTA